MFKRKNGQTQSGTKKQKTQKGTSEAYRSHMKLVILGLSGLLLLTGCSNSVEDKSSNSVELACILVRSGFGAFDKDSISVEEQARQALLYFEDAIIIFRELSVSNAKFADYVEQLNGFKTEYSSLDFFMEQRDAQPVRDFCR